MAVFRCIAGTQVIAANGSWGSGAGARGRRATGRCTSHTGTSMPGDRYVKVSGRPPRSGERFLTAIRRRRLEAAFGPLGRLSLPDRSSRAPIVLVVNSTGENL